MMDTAFNFFRRRARAAAGVCGAWGGRPKAPLVIEQ